jgi:hypothetical protein
MTPRLPQPIAAPRPSAGVKSTNAGNGSSRRTFVWLLLGALAAYCVDAGLYGGFYGHVVLTVTRHVAHGVFVGLVGHL